MGWPNLSCTFFKEGIWLGGRKQKAVLSLIFAGGSRGLVHGRLWRRDGVLAMSCAQEGVIRVKPRDSKSKL